MINYPYSEIPDFYAHLGQATSIIQIGSVKLQFPTSYLNFPNLFVLLVQLDSVTGGGLLLAGAILPAIFTTLYALLVYMIITMLSENTRVAFVASFVAITTNAAINVIFTAPGYLNWVLVLGAEYLTWRFLFADHDKSSRPLVPLLLLSVAIATGDPIYSIGYIITLLFLFSLVVLSSRTRQTLGRLYKVILISFLPSAVYYLYLSNWMIAQLPGFLGPFLHNAFSNFFFTAKVPSQGGVSTFFSEWLSTAYLTARIVYLIVGVSSVAVILWILVLKRSKYAHGKQTLAASVALAAALSGAIFFGIGEEQYAASLAGRFQLFAYLYLSLFSVYGFMYFIKKAARLQHHKVNHKVLKVTGVCMMVLVVFMYLPIHFQFASVGELAVYSSKYYVDRGIEGYTPVYRPAILAVVGFFTGQDWFAGVPPPHNRQSLNITAMSDSTNASYYRMNVIYNNGGELMEISP